MKNARLELVPMILKIGFSVLLGVLILCGIGASTASAGPVSLVLSQSSAFGILGHWCGGIREKAYATGFASPSGYPTGDVYLSTTCSTGGRGSPPHTYTAWATATWNWAANVVSATRLAIAPTVNPTFTAKDVYGDRVYNSNNVAYLVVPAPTAPTGVTVVQSGDQFQVSWTPNGVNPAAITSSTLTATPVSSTAPILTTTVSGSAKTGLVGPLQPQTTYQITVVSTTLGGPSPASIPFSVTTTAASIAPSAPTGVTARWASIDPLGTTDTLIATWQASIPGNSPVDQYEITISGSDGGGTATQTVSGTTLTASFTVDYIPNWTVTVRAHNAAGWSPWSASFSLGGL